jgi:hypothetical protein
MSELKIDMIVLTCGYFEMIFLSQHLKIEFQFIFHVFCVRYLKSMNNFALTVGECVSI